jgi:hypothetical protein
MCVVVTSCRTQIRKIIATESTTMELLYRSIPEWVAKALA